MWFLVAINFNLLSSFAKFAFDALDARQLPCDHFQLWARKFHLEDDHSPRRANTRLRHVICRHFLACSPKCERRFVTAKSSDQFFILTSPLDSVINFNSAFRWALKSSSLIRSRFEAYGFSAFYARPVCPPIGRLKLAPSALEPDLKPDLRPDIEAQTGTPFN